MAVIEADGRAVNAADVSVAYKTDVVLPEPQPPVYLLMVILKGVGESQSPQFLWESPGPRDDFYKQLVNAMG